MSESASLFEGMDRIPAAAESRDGYVRTAFKHWNAGAIADDGCNTRAEVLLEEAVERPEVTAGCKLVGGALVLPLRRHLGHRSIRSRRGPPSPARRKLGLQVGGIALPASTSRSAGTAMTWSNLRVGRWFS
ncbi:hypothetical protein [Streptomyces sp. NBC_00868]|uniref:hypothetical protein n=1 Tax=Streptomyces sp. NBC_00868 TaxID=2903683 RepID=UPI00386AD6F3